MKDFIYLLTIFVLVGIVIFIKSCQDEPEIPDFSKEKAELVTKLRQLETVKENLTAQRDSLLKIPAKIKTQIVYRERDIDENIAKDSSNSIVEYRKALQYNNELPEGTANLTFREIGLGAKLISRVPKLELTIKTYEDAIAKDEEIFANYDFQIKGHKDLNEIQKIEIKKWRQMYEDESSFWNSKELWFGLGVVGTAAIVILTGVAR